MFFGVDTFTDTAFGDLPSEIEESTPNIGNLLLTAVDPELIFVAEIYPLPVVGNVTGNPYPLMVYATMSIPSADDVNPAENIIYYSDKGFITEPTDTPANMNMRPRLKQAFNYETSIPFPGTQNPGAETNIGKVLIINTDAELDEELVYVWRGRKIILKMGGILNKGKADEIVMDYTEFVTVFKGTIEDIVWDEELIELSIQDPRSKFDLTIQQNIYDGTGGLDGDENLKGQVKPLVYGEVVNVPLVLVDSLNLVYQAHDGSVDTISEVRDNGVPLLFYSDVSDITSVTPPAGYYSTSLENGYIKLGSKPDGKVTADINGDNTPSYFYTATEILRKIAVQNTNLIDPDDLDAVSFADVLDEAPYTVGFWIQEEMSMSEVFDRLMYSIDGWWGFRRNGSLAVGLYKDPTLPSVIPTKTYKEVALEIRKLKKIETPNPSWRYKQGYRKRWYVQNEDSLAGSVSESNRFLYSNEYSFSVGQNFTTKDKFAFAKDEIAPTFLRYKTDSDVVVTSRINRDSKRRNMYKAIITRNNFRDELGDIVAITHSRFNFGTRNFVIMGIAEDSNNKTLELDLYG